MVTQTYAVPIAHPTLPQWAYPADTVTTPVLSVGPNAIALGRPPGITALQSKLVSQFEHQREPERQRQRQRHHRWTEHLIALYSNLFQVQQASSLSVRSNGDTMTTNLAVSANTSVSWITPTSTTGSGSLTQGSSLTIPAGSTVTFKLTTVGDVFKWSLSIQSDNAYINGFSQAAAGQQQITFTLPLAPSVVHVSVRQPVWIPAWT